MKRSPSSLAVKVLPGLAIAVGWLLGTLYLWRLAATGVVPADLAVWLGIGLGGLLLGVAAVGIIVARELIHKHRVAAADEEARRGRMIVDAAADAIITFDKAGRIESFNAAAARLFGYSAEEVLGREISLLIGTHDDSKVEEVLGDALKTGVAKVWADSSTFRALHKDGRMIPIELGVSKVIDEDRKVFVQIVRDLTERRQIERQRRMQYEVARALAAARDIDQAGPQVLEVIGQGVSWPVGLLWLVDPAAGMLRCRATWSAGGQGAKLLERAQGAQHAPGSGLAGRVWQRRELRWIGRLAGEQELASAPLAVADGLRSALAWPVELDGQVLGVLEFYAAQVPPPDEELLGCLYPLGLQLAQFLRRKQDEEQLRQAKDAAEAASKAKSEFLANVSHELRTPLNGIVGLTDVLLETQLTTKQHEYLGLIQSQTGTLLSLINDLLDFSKIEAARMMLEAVPFQLEAQLAPTLKTLAVRARQKGLRFTWNICTDVPPWVVGDPLRLQQVLLNLVGNAIKFTDKGEVSVTLDVAARTTRDVVLRGCVRDSGIGIPPDRREAIFEAFSQVDGSRSRRFGGTGLGLSIANRLVNLMSGKIWVESEEGKGSTFSFTACLGLGDPDREPERPVMPKPADSAWSFDSKPQPDVMGRSVLVAEDNPVNRVLLELILAKRLHQATFVTTGAEAVRAWDERPYDLVLMDVQLPEMDGLEATRQILALAKERSQRAVIVGLTALASDDDRRRCLEAGMSAYLSKPVQPAELLSLLDDLIRKHAPAG